MTSMTVPANDGTLFLGIMITLVGTLNAIPATRTLYRALKSRKWPKTQGQILTSSPKLINDDEIPIYEPFVAYSYSVDGHTHKCSQVDFHIAYTNSSNRRMKRVMDAYPEGQFRLVHYDPRHPEMACLRPGADLSLWLHACVGYGGTAIGVMLISMSQGRSMPALLIPAVLYTVASLVFLSSGWL